MYRNFNEVSELRRMPKRTLDCPRLLILDAWHTLLKIAISYCCHKPSLTLYINIQTYEIWNYYLCLPNTLMTSALEYALYMYVVNCTLLEIADVILEDLGTRQKNEPRLYLLTLYK